MFASIDRGRGSHAVCVLDGRGAVLDRSAVGHDREGLRALVARLTKRGAPGEVPVAIGRPSGLLVDALVRAGFAFTPVDPNVVKACRPRYRAASAESGPGDANILADVLRTDGHRLRLLESQSDAIEAPRALVRGRDDLVGARVALANQPAALLESSWPGAAIVACPPAARRADRGADVASPIALAFLDRCPTPEAAARLGPKRPAAFLAQHRCCGCRSPEALLERLRAAPDGSAGEAEGELVRALARTLQALVAGIAKLARRIEQAVADLPDGAIVMSFPRAGRVCAAQILAELDDVRERFQTEDQLAAEAGVAPVTCQGGKARGVGWRWACNKLLRAAMACLADNSRHASLWAVGVYARARSCDHPHAARVLARARVRVLWRARIDRRPYDPARHGGAKPFLAPADTS